MLYEISQYFLVTHAIAFLVVGIVFISLGYKGNRNLNKIKLGWIFVGISSIIATVLILVISAYWVSLYSYSHLLLLRV